MLITDVTTIKLRYDMPIPMADAIHYMPNRNTLLVQVHTDEGITGLGEAAAYGGYLESTEAIVLNELRQTIIGQDPFKVEKLWQMMATRAHQRGRRGMLMMAISGIDIAQSCPSATDGGYHRSAVWWGRCSGEQRRRRQDHPLPGDHGKGLGFDVRHQLQRLALV